MAGWQAGLESGMGSGRGIAFSRSRVLRHANPAFERMFGDGSSPVKR